MQNLGIYAKCICPHQRTSVKIWVNRLWNTYISKINLWAFPNLPIYWNVEYGHQTKHISGCLFIRKSLNNFFNCNILQLFNVKYLNSITEQIKGFLCICEYLHSRLNQTFFGAFLHGLIWDVYMISLGLAFRNGFNTSRMWIFSSILSNK